MYIAEREFKLLLFRSQKPEGVQSREGGGGPHRAGRHPPSLPPQPPPLARVAWSATPLHPHSPPPTMDTPAKG